jgi:hypothetical protein
MFDLEQQIKTWRGDLERKKVGDPEVLDELEGHLCEEFDQLRTSELSAEERFQIAVQRIGSPGSLGKEFNRLRRQRFWNFKVVPWSVKALAIWFIFRGVDHLIGMFLVVRSGNLHGYGIILSCLSILQIPLGIGLLRGQDKWRIYGLAWSAFRVVAFLYAKLFYTPFRPLVTPDGHLVSVRGLLFGLPVPLEIADIFVYANMAMLLWGGYVLTKSSVRELFRPAKAA